MCYILCMHSCYSKRIIPNNSLLKSLRHAVLYSTGTCLLTAANINTYWGSTYNVQAFANSRSLVAYTSQTGTGILPWAGDIYLLAMYNHALTPVEVASHYSLGLSNSLPTVSDSTITINEDAIAVDNYSNPAYYASATPYADLSSFTLVPYDAENTVGNAKYSATAAVPVLYISVLPVIGTLYDASTSTAITSAPQALVSPYTLKYRPTKDQYSSTASTVYASFKYFAIDGETQLKSLTDATLSIIVTSKNDPPVPTTTGSSTVYDGTTGTIVCVSGTDVDIGDSVASGNLVTLPSNGNLYQVSAGVITSTVLAATNSFGSNQLCVGYKYTGPATAAVTDGYMTTDSFTFNVQDASSSQKSVTATYSLSVYSNTITAGTTMMYCLSLFRYSNHM